MSGTMSTAQAADYIAQRTATGNRRRIIGPAKLRKWAAEGRAPAARNGNNWAWHPTAIDRWLADGMADWSKRGAA